MSNGEVKRFIALIENQTFAYDDERATCVLASDFDRLIKEKDAEIARLIQEVANRNQYKLNQEALDNVHKVYEEQLAEARQLISSLLSGVEFYSSGEFPWSSDSEGDSGSFADYILDQNKEVLKNFGRTI